MTGAITRKIELAKQIEEARLLASEQASELPSRGRRDRIPQGVIQERLERQRGIVATLEWCRDFEPDIRAWMAERKKGQGDANTTGTG